MLERCVGLSARWPGLLPDAYLTYRLYDLPPHVSQTVKCTADPVFNDATSYPLAITTDVLQYLRYASSKLEGFLLFLFRFNLTSNRLLTSLNGTFFSGQAVCGCTCLMTVMTRYRHLIWPKPQYHCGPWLQGERSEVRD